MPSSDDCAVLQAYSEGVEEARRLMDQKWGFERLPLLVPDDLRAKFRRQQVTWSEAYRAAWEAQYVSRAALDLVIQKSAAMKRGWAALDAAAEEAGHRPIFPYVWEVPLEDGTVAALVQTDAEVGRVLADGRHLNVYTAREIGHVIDALPKALQLAKVHFPGAKFQASRLPDDGNPWHVETGDPIPF